MLKWVFMGLAVVAFAVGYPWQQLTFIQVWGFRAGWVFLFLAGILFTRPRWPKIEQNSEESYQEPPSEWPD